jgi:hypothetical protein
VTSSIDEAFRDAGRVDVRRVSGELIQCVRVLVLALA